MYKNARWLGSSYDPEGGEFASLVNSRSLIQGWQNACEGCLPRTEGRQHDAGNFFSTRQKSLRKPISANSVPGHIWGGIDLLDNPHVIYGKAIFPAFKITLIDESSLVLRKTKNLFRIMYG